jgi:hypothetical protein
MSYILTGVQEGVSKKGNRYKLLHLLSDKGRTEQKFVDADTQVDPKKVLSREVLSQLFDSYETVEFGIN